MRSPVSYQTAPVSSQSTPVSSQSAPLFSLSAIARINYPSPAGSLWPARLSIARKSVECQSPASFSRDRTPEDSAVGAIDLLVFSWGDRYLTPKF
ncbi:hypothetical protein [Tychonema sp. LEGE 07203]|uniref:hypothetical protein n=1 Tax=Tychonema sp. LEGE 07203 TaxID=1828671 RepID=UPI0018829DE9|nr:hypothetical protein [Tychonema sp. LEGE 07203]MBE9093709.1 hypothetical protein [Tychonema sp. LEGE 07203]